MNFKIPRIFILSIVLVIIFTLSFGIIVNAQPKQTQSRDKDNQESFDRERLKDIDCTPDQLKDRDCILAIDCDQDQRRDRDKDCGENCICDNLCDQDQLRLRIHKEDVIEEILLYQNLKVKLEEAIEEDNDDAIEEIISQIEKVQSRLQEIVKLMKEEVEGLKLQIKQTLRSKFSNGQVIQLGNRMKFIEDEIEAIEERLE